jgi:uncharacterized protein (TIGR02118 family)
MLKLVFCLRRRPELSREEFQRYWLERHAPLVREHAETLGIRRYVQLHTLESPLNDALARPRQGPEPFDGIAELWWDDADALAASARGEAGRAASRALIEDERRFIDFSASPIWIGDEHQVVAAPR